VELTPEVLRTEWLRALDDGDRMKDGTWAPQAFAAVYRTLDSDLRVRFRSVVEGWVDGDAEREQHAARFLVVLLDSQDDLRASRESRGAVAHAVPYAEADVAVPELLDLPRETGRFEELLARLRVAGDSKK